MNEKSYTTEEKEIGYLRKNSNLIGQNKYTQEVMIITYKDGNDSGGIDVSRIISINILGRFVFLGIRGEYFVEHIMIKLPESFSKEALFRSNNVCRYCGGQFKGVFKKFCSKCCKPKDY